MGYFITRQLLLDIPTTLDSEEKQKIDDFLHLLDQCNIEKIIDDYSKNNTPKGGRKGYDPYSLFATILYGFAVAKITLRELEEYCKFDIRFFYLMNNEKPTYATFCNFINGCIKPNIDVFFSRISLKIFQSLNISFDIAYLDGTKFEANANKYKFVWKPTTFHKRLTQTASKLIADYDLIKDFKEPCLISSKTIAYAITYLNKGEKLGNYNELQKTLQVILEKVLEYEEKEAICGERKSFYKTDKDATAMCLKRDYYSGLGTNIHAAYNVQIMVVKGFIATVFVSQSRTDLRDFIPIIETFNQYYSCFPKNLCADAGYGCLENYAYLKAKGIKSFVKHQSWEGNVSGSYPDCFRLNDDKTTLTCLNGNIAKQVTLENRHPKKANSIFFKVDGCNDCEFVGYCKKYMKRLDENFKIFETNIEFLELKQDTEKNLLSREGIEIRVNRSIQVEGCFGNEKQNKEYDRLRRRGLKSVDTELKLSFLGTNISKFLDYKIKGKIPSFWKAPDDLKPGFFKKPSAKRLNKKGKKINQKIYNKDEIKHT